MMSDDRSSQYASSEATRAEGGDAPLGDDPFLVKFEPGDPKDPKNWPDSKKWVVTMSAGLLVLNATFASSAPSGISADLQEKFGMSEIVTVLTLSLFVAGYCVGPLLWGPLSEQYGRRPVFLIGFSVYTVFQVAMAVSQTTAQLLIFRFIGGAFAACPLANSGAVISDIWDARMRGKALAVFSLMPFAGPACGPFIGGYIYVGGASWRWLFWVLTIFAAVCLAVITFFMPETYQPVLLVRKAEAMRKETGDPRYYAPLEKHKVSFAKRLEHILARPFRILFTEPMLIAITLYMSYVYGLQYLLFEAFPIVFTVGHHMNAGASGLVFIPMALGGVAAVIIYLLIFNPRYEKKIAEYAPDPVPPEHRLEMAMIGCALYPIAFFWFGWTSFPSISFWAPMMSSSLMGFAVCWIFMSLFNYIIDSYISVAASALSASTVVRSAFGAGFPLFANQMYTKLNPRWASTLLGCLALIMTPMPFIFYKYGHVLRKRSKYAPTTAPRRTPSPELPPMKEVA